MLGWWLRMGTGTEMLTLRVLVKGLRHEHRHAADGGGIKTVRKWTEVRKTLPLLTRLRVEERTRTRALMEEGADLKVRKQSRRERDYVADTSISRQKVQVHVINGGYTMSLDD